MQWLIIMGAGAFLISVIITLWFVGAVFVFYSGIFAGLPLGLIGMSRVLLDSRDL